MIWLCIVLYFIAGFVFLLVGQILYHNGHDELILFEPEDDVFIFRLMVMVAVLCWPAFMIFHILVVFIPWLIMSAYKLFVAILFGTIALFKKEKVKDGME